MTMTDPHAEAGERHKQMLAQALREYPTWGHAYIAEKEKNEKLREALHRAGDALVKVQPAIDVDCVWALRIVPEAEAAIQEALRD